MRDKYRIDSQKLIYHPGRVADWLDARNDWERAKSVYPIYVEVSPYGACNHRCVFCAVDYIGYKVRSLEKDVLTERLTEMAGLGVKGVMFAGEGEPTLWKPLPEVLDHCTDVGIDTAMTTNMVPFTKRNSESFIRNCSWIKTSINAGTAKTYSMIHGTKARDFDRVMDNFRMCVGIKKDRGYTCTLGAQMLLLPENAHEAYALGEKLREIGMDYLVIKPFTQPLYSRKKRYDQFDYEELIRLESKLGELSDENFNVIFRARAMSKTFEPGRGYDRCSATPFFWSYIMSDGCVYGCLNYLLNERFNFGNINDSTFREIWEGEKRKANYQYLKKMNTRRCRVNCRMDEINRYLWKLTHSDRHVNFI